MTNTFALAQRTQWIEPSPTLAISAKAGVLRAQGKEIINLSTGEPDFDTPAHIKQAAIEAIEAGFTKYTAVDGIPSLKEAIVQKLARENQLTFTPKQIVATCGAKQAIFNLAQALLNPGDEVIIPAPYWVSYPDMCAFAGATPVILTTDMSQSYKITASQLAAAITRRTRLFILNSPSNPSGMVYTADELRALGEVLKQHPHVLILSDDIYEHIYWGNEPLTHILNVCPELMPQTMVINGVSKSYAMTGWRMGYAAGPQNLITAMTDIQSQSTSNICSITQKAAQAALNGGIACIQPMKDAFKQRHDYVHRMLNQLPGVMALPAQGAFYGFAYVKPLMEQLSINNDLELAERLLTEVGVAIVPGSAFGAPDHIRLSFATSSAQLERAFEKLATFVAKS